MMFDYRLKVFYVVAKRLSFTKAAAELCITQPAVSKHIQEIESYFRVKLFDRKGSNIRLTAAGKVLLKFCIQIFELYSNLEYELNAFTNSFSGPLRIGASTTIAQYLLPPLLAEFHNQHRNIRVSLEINNTEQIESALTKRDIDLGIVEGKSKNPALQYSDFVQDRIVPVASATSQFASIPNISIEDLLSTPVLLREPGSGTLEVIAHALKLHDVRMSDLNCEMQLGSTESLKSYLMHSESIAFLSMFSIRKELHHGELCILDIEGLSIERVFHFIRQLGDSSGLPELFVNFAQSYNIKL